MSADEVVALATIQRHRDMVRLALRQVAEELERRGLGHDLSKLEADEIAGFVRVNRIARKHRYGSEEYRAAMKSEAETIHLHYSRNSHHPEHWLKSEVPESMGLFDLVEMVCDWRGAYLGYGSQGTWRENIARQHERYAGWFSKEQWWVIKQVADLFTLE